MPDALVKGRQHAITEASPFLLRAQLRRCKCELLTTPPTPPSPSYVDLQVVNDTHIMQGYGYSGATQALKRVYRLNPSPSSCQSRRTVVREPQPLYDGQQLYAHRSR